MVMADNVKSKGEDSAMAAPGSAPRSVSANDKGGAAANREPSEVYEACMRAYRWMSQRYRKTLDALAK
jgi:hypothetical protein